MSKQTAVELLIDKLSNYDLKMIELFSKEIKQALAIEKQQIIDFADKYAEYSYRESMNNRYISPTTAEQYYNKTYGNAKV
jgi:hypothetical protein